MEATHWKKGITTELVPAGQWWDAEDYHQKYLQKQPGGYCEPPGAAVLQPAMAR